MNRSIKRRTAWDRRGRLNVETDLLIDKDSGQYVKAPFKPHYNFTNSDFAIGGFLQINSTAVTDGTIFALRGELDGPRIEARILDGDLYFNFYRTDTEYISIYSPDYVTRFIDKKTHIIVQRNGGTANNYSSSVYSIWINGVKQDVVVSNNTLGTNSHFDMGGDEAYLYIGTNVGAGFVPTDGITGSIGHFFMLVSSLTENQVRFIHRNGGVLPESSHASCVGHWPFTQRYGKVAWDVVEQYNYAKPAPKNEWNESGGIAVPKLIGDGYIEMTLDELSTGPGFTESFRFGLSEDNTYKEMNSLFIAYFQYSDNPTFYNGGIFVAGVSSGGDKVKLERLGTTINLYVNDELKFTRVGVTTSDLFIKNLIYSGTKLVYPIYLNGNLIEEYTLNKAYNDNGRLRKDSTLKSNHASLVNYTDNEAGIPDPSTNTAWLDFYKKTPIDWIDSVDEDGNIIEKESGLTEIKNALTFDGVGNYLRVPNFNVDTGDNIIIHTCFYMSTPTLNNLYFFTKVNSEDVNKPIRFYHNNAKGGKILELRWSSPSNANAAINLSSHQLSNVNSLTVLVNKTNMTVSAYLNGFKLTVTLPVTPLEFVDFNSFPGQLNIGSYFGAFNSYFNGEMFFMGIGGGKLNEKELLNFSNNTLIRNDSSQKINWKLLVDFNQPIDDTAISGKYKLKDLSPQNHDIFMEGFTANQLDPLHTDYAFKPINDLR